MAVQEKFQLWAQNFYYFKCVKCKQAARLITLPHTKRHQDVLT